MDFIIDLVKTINTEGSWEEREEKEAAMSGFPYYSIKNRNTGGTSGRRMMRRKTKRNGRLDFN